MTGITQNKQNAVISLRYLKKIKNKTKGQWVTKNSLD